MREGDATAWLGGWEGYQVETIQRRDDERREIWIFLGCTPSVPMICDGCGRGVDRVHDIKTRLVRDLPILDAATWLSVPRRRVLPTKQVAAFFGLHWHTVRELDKRALQRDLDPVDLLGEDGCRSIKAVAKDMNAAYANDVRDRCPPPRKTQTASVGHMLGVFDQPARQ